MPTYEFHHVIPLTSAQKGILARLVTNWHANTFRAPRFIVNCRFVDIQSAPRKDNYIGGKPFKSNKLFVSLRSGTGRTDEQYASMTSKLVAMWHEAVKGAPSPANELKDVFIMGTLDSAYERGWFLPMPGKFEAWVKENQDGFKELADGGDEIFQDLMHEIDERPELHG